MQKASQPAADQQNPYFPAGPVDPLLFEDFESINTTTLRPGVDDKEMAWCDGFMPLGPKRNLRTLYGVGPALWIVPRSRVVFYEFANINTNPIMVGFLADGSIFQVNTDTGVETEMAPVNTISNPSQTTIGVSQSGDQYVIIVAKQTNGYFLWDGTLFYSPGSLGPGVDLTAGGSGYTSAPDVAASGGSGTGATFVATIDAVGAVTGVIINDPGTGYLIDEVPTITASGGGGSGVVLLANMVKSVPGPGYAIGSVTVVNGGTGYSMAPTLAVSGGSGTGASLTAQITASSPVISVTMTNPGNGYLAGDTVTLGFSGGGGSGAAATVILMPFALGGSAVELYSGHVWVADGPTIIYSAPGSVSDFSTANGGGNFTSTDSFLRVQYTQLIATNGFLYLIGDSSVNYISGVSTAGSPPTTTFTNQNADPEVGTVWPTTVDVFGRNIVFANAFGAHVSYGAAVTKISEKLDGIYNTSPNFASLIPSAAKAIIFGKKVWILLLPIIDPISGAQVNKLFMWNGAKAWWASGQDVALTYIQHQEIDSVLTAYGTDGTTVWPLFQQPSSGFTKIVQSKLWDRPGGYQFTKAATRLWGLARYYSLDAPELLISVDNEFSAAENEITLLPPAVIWKNVNGDVMIWTDADGDTMTWRVDGNTVLDPDAVGQQGVLTGLTIQTDSADMAIISFMLRDEIAAYRG